jgi:hypothetical protein
MLKRGLMFLGGALKSNWIPALGIWVMGALLVLFYYLGGGVHTAAEHILIIRNNLGLLFPAVSEVLFGSLLPTLTQVLLCPTERSSAIKRLPWMIPFWAYKGIECELLYRAQAYVFGTGTDFVTVACKVAVDQFVYNPCLGAITMILYMRLVARKVGELPADTPIMPRGWYTLFVVPILVATWALWVPAVSLVYMMPTQLQLPLSNMILWLWAMLLVFMARQDGPVEK